RELVQTEYSASVLLARLLCACACESIGSSHRGWEGFWWLASGPSGRTLQRFERSGLVEVDHRVKLRRESRLEVVTSALGLRSVDDPDRALEPRLVEPRHGLTTQDRQQKLVDVRLVKERLVASRQRRTNLFPLCGPI